MIENNLPYEGIKMDSILFLLLIFVAVLASFIISGIIIYKSNQKTRHTNNSIDFTEQIVQMISADFLRIGWTSWDSSIHRAPGQDERMRRAATSHSMKLLEFDPDNGKFLVVGESGKKYAVDEHSCSCPDFKARGLPCKHMYFVAMSGGK